MDTFLHQKFKDNLNTQVLIKSGTSILLGLSGGQDSLCMLKLFMDIQKRYNLNIGIINIDHQWRKDTVSNTLHIINVMTSLNIKIYIYGTTPCSYTEEEARNMRYQLFLQAAQKQGYSFIATAHSLNDNIETSLHNIFRGSDLDGLQSLAWGRNIQDKVKLIRPMLNIQRWEIEWFCRYFSLPIWHDVSNLECITDRNRIRQELVPYLKFHFPYNIENQIGKFIEYTYHDCEYIRQNTLKLYLQIKHPCWLALNNYRLINQHRSLQRRVLQLFLLHNTNISLPYILLNRLLRSTNSQSGIRIKYNHLIVCNNNKWIYIYYNRSISYNNFS
jgi:tRNA(Ile)-lysidine synthase